MTSWYAESSEKAVKELQSSIEAGLTSNEAELRLKKYGFNELKKRKPISLFSIFVSQFKSPMIYLLLFAALIAFMMKEITDTLVILSVLLINATVGTFQEKRAAVSLEALKRLTATMTRVIRSGREEVIDSKYLVPGDILLLNEGDAVGADMRLLHTASLYVSEASLTGESVPVPKSTSPLPVSTSLADRSNMVYAGTYVTKGRGTAIVTATGQGTEIGKIVHLTQATKKSTTPLEEKIAQFSHFILIAAFFVFISVILLGLAREHNFLAIFPIALTQVVSMVPEGLPVALTVALAVGVQRMAKQGAIIRKLDAVETLGSTTVICTDKTGTLTKNEMTVVELWLPGVERIKVTGSGYSPEGMINHPLEDLPLQELLKTAALCNNAKGTIGDPTEVALLTLASKGGIDPENLRNQYERLEEIPFDSESKMMAVLVKRGETRKIHIKGAPEAIRALCSSYPDQEMKQEELQMAENGLRLLAFAVIKNPAFDWTGTWESLKGKACLLGIAGQLDPPRPEVFEAVKACRSAGIKPVMITGDHKITGLSIAKTLGIARQGDMAVEGDELDAYTKEELAANLAHISVFARVHPAQKLEIVKAWQKKHATVAMTGDGVNDAPALAKADVGVSMGITGTEVAKEAAKVVITDDHFATIVRAIMEGRIVHRNLKKMLLYLVSTNVTELLVLYFALIFGYPLPLAAVQILWVNLVTDGVSQIPLILEPGEGDESVLPPVPRHEALINKPMLKRMALMTPVMAFSTLFYFLYRLSSGLPFAQVQTGTFTVLAVCQWFNALNCRSQTLSAFSGLFTNRYLLIGLVIGNLLHMGAVFLKPLNNILHTVPIPLSEVFFIGSVSSLVLWVEEVRKMWVRNSSR